jgi:hypothetical protein
MLNLVSKVNDELALTHSVWEIKIRRFLWIDNFVGITVFNVNKLKEK